MDSAAPEVSSASSNIIRLNGIEVGNDHSKPHVININFNQSLPQSRLREFFESLGQSLNTLGGQPRPNDRRSETPPVGTARLISEAKTIVEVSQIMAGLAAISLGVILCLVNGGLTSGNWTAFWTGFPFIFSGVIALIKEKMNSSIWAVTAISLSFASFVLAIAGIVLVAVDLSCYYQFSWTASQMCASQGSFGSSGQGTGYTTLLNSVKTLLVLDIVFGLITSLCSVACDVWVCIYNPHPGQDTEPFGVNGSRLHFPSSLLPPAYEEMPTSMQVV